LSWLALVLGILLQVLLAWAWLEPFGLSHGGEHCACLWHWQSLSPLGLPWCLPPWCRSCLLGHGLSPLGLAMVVNTVLASGIGSPCLLLACHSPSPPTHPCFAGVALLLLLWGGVAVYKPIGVIGVCFIFNMCGSNVSKARAWHKNILFGFECQCQQAINM